MDKITLQNLAFYGYHGVYNSEREQGQRFYLDLELNLDLTAAGESDQLADTLDYTVVYQEVKTIVETQRYQLLEALGAAICRKILAGGLVKTMTVRIRKPSVAINGVLDYVQIEITRSVDQ